MILKARPALKFLRAEQEGGKVVAVVDYDGREERWESWRLQARLDGLLLDGYDTSEESAALRAIQDFKRGEDI
jgi:hypothetical protein